jgi:hypothetical protein
MEKTPSASKCWEGRIRFEELPQFTLRFPSKNEAPKHPPGPPMTLGNMPGQGVHHLIAF